MGSYCYILPILLYLYHLIILIDLYIIRSKRGYGVTTQLMEKVKSFADNFGNNRITLCTSVENHKARALYDKLNDKIGDQFVYYFLKTR